MQNAYTSIYATILPLLFYSLSIAIRRPFMITFHTNDNEVVASTSPTGVNSEETTTPQGIIGFSLDYKQISC